MKIKYVLAFMTVSAAFLLSACDFDGMKASINQFAQGGKSPAEIAADVCPGAQTLLAIAEPFTSVAAPAVAAQMPAARVAVSAVCDASQATGALANLREFHERAAPAIMAVIDGSTLPADRKAAIRSDYQRLHAIVGALLAAFPEPVNSGNPSGNSPALATA